MIAFIDALATLAASIAALMALLLYRVERKRDHVRFTTVAPRLVNLATSIDTARVLARSVSGSNKTLRSSSGIVAMREVTQRTAQAIDELRVLLFEAGAAGPVTMAYLVMAQKQLEPAVLHASGLAEDGESYRGKPRVVLDNLERAVWLIDGAEKSIPESQRTFPLLFRRYDFNDHLNMVTAAFADRFPKAVENGEQPPREPN